MKIDIAEAVRNEGEIYSAEYTGPFGSIDFLGERYVFSNPVRVNVDYFFNGEGIVVTGNLTAETEVACSRCLKKFLYTVDVKFAEYYKKQPEDGVYLYTGEQIELDQMLQDNIVINLPTKQLCKEDCKGLCSKCGCDLNEGNCSCEDDIDETNPFYGLSKLYDDEEV